MPTKRPESLTLENQEDRGACALEELLALRARKDLESQISSRNEIERREMGRMTIYISLDEDEVIALLFG